MIQEPTAAGTSKAAPENSEYNRLRRFGFTRFTDPVDFFLDRQFVQARKRQTKQQAYPAVKNHKGIAESPFDLLWRSHYGGRIGNAPVCGHRLAGPNGTNFLRSVIADREDKIEVWCAWFGKLIPVLTP